MSTQDIRWIQRYNHFAQAFAQMERAVMLAKARPLSELEEQGLIQAFKFTHELAWNVLKDFFETQGWAASTVQKTVREKPSKKA